MMLRVSSASCIKRFEQCGSVMKSAQRPSQALQQVLLNLLVIRRERDVGAEMKSVRTERQGIKAARFVVRELEGRGIRTELIDPKERKLPLLDCMYKESTFSRVPLHTADVHRQDPLG